MAMLALTAMLAICKSAGWIGASWVWVLSPFWVPVIEAFLVVIAKLLDN